jgi:hypothetical protein
VTITAEAPALSALTDAELVALYGPDDTLNAAILAEGQRRDDQVAARNSRRNDPVRSDWETAAYAQMLAAEAATCGNLVARDSKITDAWQLWSGNERTAQANATEELRNFWRDVSPRLTVTAYQQQLQDNQEEYRDQLDEDASDAVRRGAGADSEGPAGRGVGAADSVSRSAASGAEAGSSSDHGPVRDLGHVRSGAVMTAELDVPVLLPSNGAATLDATVSWLQRFVSFPSEHAANIAAVWAAGTHCTDRDMIMVHAAWPRLIFTGAKDSGKTFAMETIASLSARPDITSDITGPALAKEIATEHPTVGIDELDLIVGGGAGASDLRGILNAGYRRSGAVRRAAGKTPVFAPVMLAGLSDVVRGNACLDTLRSRSVILDMVPAQHGAIERYRDRLHASGAAAISEALASWGARHAIDVAEAWPDEVPGLVNRAEEIAMPLLAIAEVAGGHWPAKIRAALSALLAGQDDEPAKVTPAERLLSDVRACWTGSQMPSKVLAERLSWIKDGPWGAIFPDPARAGSELARYLGVHGISPVKIWLADESRSVQGYRLAQFTALWDGPEVDQVADLHSSGNSLPAERDAA